jgi:hypothetical protein
MFAKTKAKQKKKRVEKEFVKKRSMINASFDRKEDYFLEVIDLSLKHCETLHNGFLEEKAILEAEKN